MLTVFAIIALEKPVRRPHSAGPVPRPKERAQVPRSLILEFRLCDLRAPFRGVSSLSKALPSSTECSIQLCFSPHKIHFLSATLHWMIEKPVWPFTVDTSNKSRSALDFARQHFSQQPNETDCGKEIRVAIQCSIVDWVTTAETFHPSDHSIPSWPRSLRQFKEFLYPRRSQLTCSFFIYFWYIQIILLEWLKSSWLLE